MILITRWVQNPNYAGLPVKWLTTMTTVCHRDAWPYWSEPQLPCFQMKQPFIPVVKWIAATYASGDQKTPHSVQEHVRDSKKVNLCCGMMKDRIIRINVPLFNDPTVTGNIYQMLKQFALPQQRNVTFQKDGAPPHWSLGMHKRSCMNDTGFEFNEINYDNVNLQSPHFQSLHSSFAGLKTCVSLNARSCVRSLNITVGELKQLDLQVVQNC